MAISLQKGGNVSLSKQVPGLKRVRFGLGWDLRKTDGSAFDSGRFGVCAGRRWQGAE
jgi:tellurium resistance protein TerD